MNKLNYNPDVLSCLANLSNDEVFTPPALANQMLDMLPQELFRSPDTKFLDPCAKSGVFLREIAKRLIEGLADQIPDLQERIDHIMHHQLYGIAITRLTSLMSRRSLYCSKDANCKYSISLFDDADGNIRFKDIRHTWQNGKCIYCGANKEEYERGDKKESFAYQFIHTNNPEELQNMKFDVIIGNPPYQLSTAGEDNGAQARPIYQKFVEQANKLSPRYLVMITPSRWFAGGWGLEEFRNTMIACNHIRIIHDFQNSQDCFNGVDIKGGVSYFLYDREYIGPCTFYSHEANEIRSVKERYLKEEGCNILVRYNDLITIYRKVTTKDFQTFKDIVSPRSPFGLNTNHRGHIHKQTDDVKYFERSGYSYISKSCITRCIEWIDKYKLFVPKAAEDGKLPGKIIGKITRGEPGTICSGTYLVVGPFDSLNVMENVLSYMKTKFFRMMVAVNKISQDSYNIVYASVPLQDFTRPWTDEELYKKYELSKEEIAFIESMIRPME